MGRRKIDIAYLTDDRVRKASVFCIDDLQPQLVPMRLMGDFILCLLHVRLLDSLAFTAGDFLQA